MGQVKFRSATPDEAGALVAIKQAAIDQIETPAYSQRQLAAWRPDDDATTDFERAIESAQFDVLVATLDGEPVAYGVLRPGANRIDAIFVHPRARGRGIGSSLVRQFESRARMQDLPELTIVASLNAKSFYETLGYWDFGRERRTIEGVDLEFAIMRKVFEFDEQEAEG